jgi:hypothetical protein
MSMAAGDDPMGEREVSPMSALRSSLGLGSLLVVLALRVGTVSGAALATDASPEPISSPVDASPVAETIHGWPGTRSEPGGLYSWVLPANGRSWTSWMHKVPATWTDTAPNSVELTFYAAEPLAPLPVMGHAARYSPDVHTEMWLFDVDGTMVAILIDSFPDTDSALVAEARAVVESIVIEPTESGHRLVFRLLEGWDSG